MSQPAARLLTMLELLQSRNRMTGVELAERLGVDERTVRRYASGLADLGIPVEAERGRYGGYRVLPGYRLPPLMLTDDEATAVVVGLMVGRRLGLSAGTEGALAKVRRVLPSAVGDRVEALRETLGFTLMPREGATPDTTALLVLAEAARSHRRVRLSYRSWRGADTDRDLDPYGLVFHSGRWYVAGHDHRSAEVRTFRVDRVRAAESSPGTYDVPEDFDPVAHVTASLATVPYTHEVEVVLETTLTEARRRVPPSTATLTEVDGGVLLRTRAQRLEGMARMLAGLGWPFTIRAPEELRAAVRDLAADLVARADATEH